MKIYSRLAVLLSAFMITSCSENLEEPGNAGNANIEACSTSLRPRSRSQESEPAYSSRMETDMLCWWEYAGTAAASPWTISS